MPEADGRPIDRMATPGTTCSLETDRLVLRPLATEDADALHRISNEPGVRRYLWDDQAVEKATIRRLIARSVRMFSEDGIGLFGVRMRGVDNLLGFCGFVRVEGMKEPELAYELTQVAWGKGFATEACVACLRQAFEETGLERVIAGTDAPNAASLRVIENLGMRFVGNINVNAPDEPYYAVYPEEFFAATRERGR